MADNLIVTDANADQQTLAAPQYGTAKYPQIVNWSPKQIISAASTNATNVKNAKGTVGGVNVGNTNAAARYLKLYDKASAPTVGTDTPVATILIPAGGRADVVFPGGLAFALGIGFALTTGAANNDTGAVAASEITGVLTYL